MVTEVGALSSKAHLKFTSNGRYRFYHPQIYLFLNRPHLVSHQLKLARVEARLLSWNLMVRYRAPPTSMSDFFSSIPFALPST